MCVLDEIQVKTDFPRCQHWPSMKRYMFPQYALEATFDQFPLPNEVLQMHRWYFHLKG